jgi:lysophospholipase L1-like esterase
MEYKKVKLGGNKDYSYIKIDATQGDGGIKQYTYQLVNDDLSPFDLTGLTVMFRGNNSVGDLTEGTVEVVDPVNGRIKFHLSETITSISGEYKRAYFIVTNGEETVASCNIRLNLKSAVDISAPVATKYMSRLDKLIAQFQEIFTTFMTTTQAKMSDMEQRFANMLPINGKTNIQNNSIPVNKLDFIEVGKNLFNKDDTVSGYVNPANGTISANVSYKTSDYINVQNRSVTLSNIRFYAIYNVDQTFISGGTLAVGETKTITQTGEYLIRVTPHSNTLNTAQVEYGNIATGYEPYTAKLKGVSANVATNENTDINLPSRLYTTVGKTLTIYTQNLIKHDIKNFNFNFNRGTQLAKSYYETYTTSGNLQIDLYDLDGKILKTETHSVVASQPRTTPVKTILLGDSTIKSENDVNGVLGRAMKDELGANLVLLGTQGTAPYQHEGRAGWKFADYRKEKTGSLTNPFYNPTTNDFDFQYYLTNSAIEKPDVVFIQLGINDVFYNSSDTTVEATIKTMITDLNFIKNSIKSVDSNIKVVYNLPTPPTSNVDQFAINYPNTRYTQWRVRLNNNLVVKRMIEEFDNTDIDLLAINASLDTVNNIRDGVHPKNEGYAQIAQTLCAYLNSIN